MRHAHKNADTIVLQMFLRLLPAQILSMAVSSLGTLINGLVVGNCLPSTAMVALGFVNPLTAVFAAIAAVISGGSRVLYGRYIGRNDRERSDTLFSGAVASAVVIGLALWLCLTVLAVPFAVCLGAEAEAVDATAEYIRALSLGIIPTLLIPMLMVFLQMSGEAAYAFYSSVLLVLRLSVPFGTLGIWYSYTLAEALALLIVCGKCRLECGHAPKTAADFLWLEEDFEPREHFALSVTDMEQVLSVSQSLTDFCLQCGVDERRAKLCGLCMEEMAGNVVAHGFPRSRHRNPTIDLFVSLDEHGTMLLRLQDNCPAFDPAVKFGAPDPDDPCKNIGIRMVSKLAQSMDYQSSFGINALTIRL